jgi:hypothetical protein
MLTDYFGEDRRPQRWNHRTARQGLSSWMLKNLPISQARDEHDSQALILTVSPVPLVSRDYPAGSCSVPLDVQASEIPTCPQIFSAAC